MALDANSRENMLALNRKVGHSAGVRGLETGEGNIHTFGEQKCQYFPAGSAVKKIRLPMQEMWVQSLGREDPLEGEMATHSSVLAWRIPSQTSLSGYSPWGHRELDTT